jgi:hypothetical protein
MIRGCRRLSSTLLGAASADDLPGSRPRRPARDRQNDEALEPFNLGAARPSAR